MRTESRYPTESEPAGWGEINVRKHQYRTNRGASGIDTEISCLVISENHQIASSPDVGLCVVVLGSINIVPKLGGALLGFLSLTLSDICKRSKSDPALSLMLCVVHERRVWRKPLECGGL